MDVCVSARQDEIPNYTCGRDSRSVALLTGASWAASAQIGPLLELYRFPQLTFGSFDPTLSDSGQFPSLYQMAAKDTALALAMVSLMLHFSWTWAGLIVTEDSDCTLRNCPPNASLAWLSRNRFDTAMSPENYNVYNAVYAVAHTLHTMLYEHVQLSSMENPSTMMIPSRWQLHPFLKNTHFRNPVGEHVHLDEKNRLDAKKAPQEGKAACCFDCIPCPEDEIANATDMEQCVKCPDHQYANAQRNRCLQKSASCLAYADPLGTALAAAALGLTVLAAAVLLLFVRHRDTPVIKANNRALSYTLLVSLSFCFLCSLLFIGCPTTATCVLQQSTFGTAFTVAVSTVLAKTVTVVLAFKVTAPGRRTRKLLMSGAPNYIIPICSLIQLTLCGIWMGTSPPFIDTDAHSEHGHIIIVCNKGSLTAFYCVLGYLGSLALGSFTLAFLARNLPDTFNEAKYLTFSMLVFCSVWVTFLPVYHSTQGKAMVAMEVFSILASSAGLLGCIFGPKCYIVLVRPDRNSVRGFREKIQPGTQKP
ncbi:vomeronasal type-2 receptor 116-like [Ctenodactylus gundi]